jgi:hypothetical protein
MILQPLKLHIIEGGELLKGGGSHIAKRRYRTIVYIIFSMRYTTAVPYDMGISCQVIRGVERVRYSEKHCALSLNLKLLRLECVA